MNRLRCMEGRKWDYREKDAEDEADKQEKNKRKRSFTVVLTGSADGWHEKGRFRRQEELETDIPLN